MNVVQRNAYNQALSTRVSYGQPAAAYLGHVPPLVVVGLAVERGVVPHDEVQALARRDVVCAVPLRAQVHHAHALHVVAQVGIESKV
jgi:hypothetical protein